MSRHRRQPSRVLPPELLAGDEIQRRVSTESSHARESSAAASLGLDNGPVGSGVSSTGESSAGHKAEQAAATTADANSPATPKKPPAPKNT